MLAVATLTGHGLKDPDRVVKTVAPPITVPASLDAIVSTLGF
jgi:threonine synthase